jgi:hypothetical protein
VRSDGGDAGELLVNLRQLRGATGLAWEVTVKVYGVAVTMPQG